MEVTSLVNFYAKDVQRVSSLAPAVWKNTLRVQNAGIVDVGMTYGAGLQDELLFGLDVCLCPSLKGSL